MCGRPIFRGERVTEVRQITLPMSGFEPLQEEARAAGIEFVDRTVREWASGENRFDGPGEMLCGVFEGDVLIAIGGLTRDPFAGEPEVGRLRRIYVRRACRNRGVGAQIVEFLVGEAMKSFRAVRLRAENDGAARLYERLGFCPLVDPEATHVLWF